MLRLLNGELWSRMSALGGKRTLPYQPKVERLPSCEPSKRGTGQNGLIACDEESVTRKFTGSLIPLRGVRLAGVRSKCLITEGSLRHYERAFFA